MTPSTLLTDRQRDVLRLASRGLTDRAIAGELNIAHATAQKHMANILSRLHVPNRTAAAAMLAGERECVCGSTS